MSQSKWVRVGSVRRFDHVKPDKVQALKPLEEAAEVFGAFQGTCIDYSNPKGEYSCSSCKEAADCYAMSRVVDECCDVIVATCNLLAALGVSDLTEAMAELERKNERRGRYGDK